MDLAELRSLYDLSDFTAVVTGRAGVLGATLRLVSPAAAFSDV